MAAERVRLADAGTSGGPVGDLRGHRHVSQVLRRLGAITLAALRDASARPGIEPA